MTAEEFRLYVVFSWCQSYMGAWGVMGRKPISQDRFRLN